MICPKCGSILPDGSIFCSKCGEKLPEPAPVIPAEQNAPEAAPVIPAEQNVSEAAPVIPVEQSVPEAAPVIPAEQNVPAAAAPAYAAPVTVPNPGFVPPKKKLSRTTLIGVAAVVIVAVIAVIGLKALFSGSGSDNAYAYLSDGKYELITNLDKDQTIEIASSRSDSTASKLLSFSPDGKYIYYYTKYDSYTDTGSLCRAEYGKLKADPGKNDKYIETVAANVALGFRFLDDGSVAYKNGDGTLYYFNGKEATQIARNVVSYYIDGADRIVYIVQDVFDGYNLYGVVLNDIDNRLDLDFGLSSSYLYASDGFDNILYTKNEDDGSETLYTVGFQKKPEKLGEKANYVTRLGDKTYFVAASGETLSLYDFVEDTYAAADAGITEPDPDDFSVPRYSYEMVHGSNLSESDFDELYTSCTKDLYMYGESTWWCYSMEEAVKRNWGDNTERLVAATQSFIDKFGSSADKNGYILVTDEVKAALKEIQKNADNPEKEWQWMWLCYNKYQSGTDTDYDAYYDAWDKWYEADSRIDLRKSLQNKENDYDIRTLYCFDQGKLSVIHENVLDVRGYTGGLLFNTTELVSDTVRLENISSIYDVRDLLSIDRKAENYILLSDGSICRMSAGAAKTYAEAYNSGYATPYFGDKTVYLCDSDNVLSAAPINGGVVGDFTVITDEVQVLSADGDTLYYASGAYQSNDRTYCDLYSYSKGASTRLARDVLLSNIKLYEDGVILAYTGYRNYYGYELTMFDPKGEATLIGDNITQYIRVDKSTLLYISDGDLYCYNGKEKRLVRRDVDQLWSRNSMEVRRTFGWYDYDYDYYN